MTAPPSPPSTTQEPAAAPTPAAGPECARAQASASSTTWGSPSAGGRRFMRAFFRALSDEGTFDVRTNPSLWLGFLLAIPIPLLMFAWHAPLWLRLASLLAPLAWAVIMGAAGRVGIIAQREQQRMLEEARRAREAAERARVTLAETEKSLDLEVERREELEQRQREVLDELKLAQAVQRTLLPPNLIRPDLEVAVRNIPCAYVGGDYLHASVVGERWLYLCVADVSGHGVSAALVVARLHGLVRRITLEAQTPFSMLDEIHRAALRILQHTYFFVTIGVFRLELATGRLEYATAGHPGQVLQRTDGTQEILRTPNRLLGMDGDVFDSERPTGETTLKPGDTLVLFTDGLFEILSGGDGTLLGESGLRKRIAGLSGLSPTLMAGEVLQELADFQGRSTFEDDVTLMVARYLGPQPASTPPTAAAPPAPLAATPARP
jgi:serine phosphatase RsbU (regulator of sigma subunit)